MLRIKGSIFMREILFFLCSISFMVANPKNFPNPLTGN
ncbi:hypothetical protein BREVNS_1002 [Brevinematales bacterium NS]|nr:hypothetical protein BREVNS_1002 [Brevinematales bacterium NS]